MSSDLDPQKSALHFFSKTFLLVISKTCHLSEKIGFHQHVHIFVWVSLAVIPLMMYMIKVSYLCVLWKLIESVFLVYTHEVHGL